MISLSYLFLAAAVLVLIGVSFGLSRWLKFRNAGLIWIASAWVIAIASAWGMNRFGLTYFKLDGLAVIATGVVVLLLMFMLLVRSGVLGALTLLVSNTAVAVLMLAAGYFVLSQEQKHEALELLSAAMPSSQVVNLDVRPERLLKEPVEVVDIEEAYFSEKELLPKGQLAQKRKTLVTRKYHDVSSAELGKYRGYQVKITKKDGRVLTGVVVSANARKVVIDYYHAQGQGKIEAPVAFSSIRKIQVFK